MKGLCISECADLSNIGGFEFLAVDLNVFSSQTF